MDYRETGRGILAGLMGEDYVKAKDANKDKYVDLSFLK